MKSFSQYHDLASISSSSSINFSSISEVDDDFIADSNVSQDDFEVNNNTSSTSTTASDFLCGGVHSKLKENNNDSSSRTDDIQEYYDNNTGNENSSWVETDNTPKMMESDNGKIVYKPKRAAIYLPLVSKRVYDYENQKQRHGGDHFCSNNITGNNEYKNCEGAVSTKRVRIKEPTHLDDTEEECSQYLRDFDYADDSDNSTVDDNYVSSKEVLDNHGDKLSPYELQEIQNYKRIYYFGEKCAEKIGISNKQWSKYNSDNDGYDDNCNYYHIVERDHINYRYEIIKLLGYGTFGTVIKVYDHKKRDYFAIKIVRNEKRFRKAALKEVKILVDISTPRCSQDLSGDRTTKNEEDILDDKCISFNNNTDLNLINNDNGAKSSVKIINYFSFRSHICITFNLHKLSLSQYIHEDSYKRKQIDLTKKIAYQLCESLDYYKKKHIIHADLKPDNILIENESNNDIKVIDFGAAWYDQNVIETQLYSNNSIIKSGINNNNSMSNKNNYNCNKGYANFHFYIQSRSYRAPEIILGVPFDYSIDMWSLGCIIYEVYMKKKLFNGDSEYDQLMKIMNIIGNPSEKLLHKSMRKIEFFKRDFTPRRCKNENNDNNNNVSNHGRTDSNSEDIYDRDDEYYIPPEERFEEKVDQIRYLTKLYNNFIDDNHNHHNHEDDREKGDVVEAVTPDDNRKKLSEFLQTDDEKLVDFLNGCLQLDPSKRLTPEEALEHPFFASLK